MEYGYEVSCIEPFYGDSGEVRYYACPENVGDSNFYYEAPKEEIKLFKT